MDASSDDDSLLKPATHPRAACPRGEASGVGAGVASNKPGLAAALPPPQLLERVLVAYSAIENTVRGEAREIEAELETIHTAHTIAEQLSVAGIQAQPYVVYDLDDVHRIASEFDVNRTLVFNLCEHLQGDSHRDVEVVQRMVDLDIQYTGATRRALANCLDKSRAKAMLQAAGVPTARYQVFTCADEPIHVPLPAFVKPLAEDASIGIDRDSVVFDEAALRRRVAYLLDAYREPALVEEFIDRREFNVGMWGNGKLDILPVAELDYCDWDDPYRRFLHFDAKWNPDAIEYQTMYVRCPADIDDTLAEKIRRVARQAYKVMGCRDYARVDLRLHHGEPYVLEVNPNPCLSPDSGFPNAARVAGYDYPAMVARIARWAWWRRSPRSADDTCAAS
jgi:D-alanine-D-alanine ligase